MEKSGILTTAVIIDDVTADRICKKAEAYLHESGIKWGRSVDPSIIGGFVVRVDDRVINMSVDFQLESISGKPRIKTPKEKNASEISTGDLVRGLKNQLRGFDFKPQVHSVGKVYFSADGIVKIDGLPDCEYGELLALPNGGVAMAFNLAKNEGVWAVLLSGEDDVSEGDEAQTTGLVASVPVGDNLIGRVIDSFGNPIDDRGLIEYEHVRPLESPAPFIVERGKVNKPLMTGLLAIDSMIPIGRGQRELIIGDRQTGKTAIAVDTILNQKGKGVICVYVAIGQKASTVAQLADTFRQMGALDYTVIVSATAGDSILMQYCAPYAGCAIGEEFMRQGRDVLIVYDDLSKHAVAYRTLSLLLHRPPGREAYPGDVFYLHSRLLERAAKLSDELGGGSMTALPIVETMEGDISAYIPTNVISITDGQIVLESELFFSGVRPAVNVGLSVSRVGGSAQEKAMRKVSGKLRLDLAQYRELEVFSRFSSDLDASTQQQLAQGVRLTEALKQGQFHPLSTENQVMLLFAVENRMLADVPLNKIGAFKEEFFSFMSSVHPEIGSTIASTGELSDETAEALKKATEEIKDNFLEGLKTAK